MSKTWSKPTDTKIMMKLTTIVENSKFDGDRNSSSDDDDVAVVVFFLPDRLVSIG